MAVLVFRARRWRSPCRRFPVDYVTVYHTDYPIVCPGVYQLRITRSLISFYRTIFPVMPVEKNCINSPAYGTRRTSTFAAPCLGIVPIQLLTPSVQPESHEYILGFWNSVTSSNIFIIIASRLPKQKRGKIQNSVLFRTSFVSRPFCLAGFEVY